MRRVFRPRSARWVAVAVPAVTVVWLLPGAQGLSSAAQLSSGAASPAAAASARSQATGASDISNLGGSGLSGATPVITLSGWNVPQVSIPAPVP